jgi:hypothetical protein
MFIASNYITWQDKKRKMSLIERYLFRRKDQEENKKVLIGRIYKLYFCFPERDLENNISWGEGEVLLSKELLNSLDGKTQSAERRVKITVSAIDGEKDFNVDLAVELKERVIEFSINCNHEININQRTENGRERYNSTEQWKFLEQAIMVGEKIVALSN